MANPEHVSILEKGVSEWNKWRLEHLDIDPNLNGADLEGVDLSEANLSHANLNGADLHRAKLTQAVLRSAYLGNANLGWANLDGAVVAMAYLTVEDEAKRPLARTVLLRMLFDLVHALQCSFL